MYVHRYSDRGALHRGGQEHIGEVHVSERDIQTGRVLRGLSFLQRLFFFLKSQKFPGGVFRKNNSELEFILSLVYAMKCATVFTALVIPMGL